MPRIPQPLLPQEPTPETMVDDAIRDRVQRLVDSMALVLPGEVFSEDRISRNRVNLGPGGHGSLSPAKDATTFSAPFGAETPGLYVGRDATYLGIDFTEAVSIGPGAVVVFRNCTFRSLMSLTLAFQITLGAGAKASFVQCDFKTAMGTSLIDNPGLAADVMVVGCTNHTGTAMGTVTEIGTLV